MIIFVIFSLFTIANSGTIPWYARQLKDNSFALNEISATAVNAIQSAVEKYGSLENTKKFRQADASPEDVAEEVSKTFFCLKGRGRGESFSTIDIYDSSSIDMIWNWMYGRIGVQWFK